RRPKVLHQKLGERVADHGAAANPHDGEPRGHAAAIGKPFDERRDGRDVAEAEAAAADHARAEIQQPDLMELNAKRGDEEAAAPADAGDDTGFARTFTFDPAAEQRRR